MNAKKFEWKPIVIFLICAFLLGACGPAKPVTPTIPPLPKVGEGFWKWLGMGTTAPTPSGYDTLNRIWFLSGSDMATIQGAQGTLWSEGSSFEKKGFDGTGLSLALGICEEGGKCKIKVVGLGQNALLTTTRYIVFYQVEVIK